MSIFKSHLSQLKSIGNLLATHTQSHPKSLSMEWLYTAFFSGYQFTPAAILYVLLKEESFFF